ncbi:MAG: sulfatase-like hydrolase/transferase [Limisphaerales bacterium]
MQGLGIQGVALAAERPPNIVFIMADDLGWADLGCQGSTYYETPHIDRLAAQGMRFTHAYSAGPNCQPSRAALMTGQYGPRTGIYTVGNTNRFDWSMRPLAPVANTVRLAPEAVTFAEVLRERRYATGLFGKWHLGSDPAHHPRAQGFDEALVSEGRHYGFQTIPPVEVGDKEYLADFLTDRAEDFIRRHRDQPFLLCLHHFAVHSPHRAKPERAAAFRGKPAAGGHWNPVYAGMIASVDESVGRVTGLLDELGLAADTLVIFTSDNGGVGGYAAAGVPTRESITANGPLRGGKGMLYEGGVRVPFIVRWPGHVAAGSTSGTPVHGVDVFPTMVGVSGAGLPAGHVVDGVDLNPILLGGPEARLPRDTLFWHFPGYLGSGPDIWRTTPAGAVRRGDLKLLEFFETGRVELHDLARDPGQLRNLAGDQPGLVRELHRELVAWRERVGAPMPTRNPTPRGGPPGVVVAHSPASSRTYLGSPSLVQMPDGEWIASHDFFGPGTTGDRVAIHASRDRGRTWAKRADIEGGFWSTLFVHRGALHLIGTSRQDGDVVIRRSKDQGRTWTKPEDGRTGLLLSDAKYHCAPTPVVVHGGRIWRAFEDVMGPGGWGSNFRAFMMSAPENADLLDASQWTASNRLGRDPDGLGGRFGGWLEGNAVVAPDGRIVNLLRADYRDPEEKAAWIDVSADGTVSRFDPRTGFIGFPGGCKKFTVRWDPVARAYWTLGNYIPPEQRGGNVERTRNTLALARSMDLRNWELRAVVLHHPDRENHGFQYADWQVEGDDLVALVRTAYDDGEGGAHGSHDANFITFHRWPGFRDLRGDVSGLLKSWP